MLTSITANVVVTLENLDLDTIVHEGAHTAQRQALAADFFSNVNDPAYDLKQSLLNIQKYDRENDAYRTESYYVQYRGGETQIWNKGWSEATRQTKINNKIADGYKDSKGKSITPNNRGERMY
jgi:hypothetical protein